MTPTSRRHICIYCERFDRARSACEVSGLDLAAHCNSGTCPHPDGSMFDMEPAERMKRYRAEVLETFDPEEEKRRLQQGGCCGQGSTAGVA